MVQTFFPLAPCIRRKMVAAGLVFSTFAAAQVPRITPDQAAKAFTALQSGQFERVYIQEVAQAHEIRAIPLLEDKFQHSEDDLITKGVIAEALVHLGDSNDMYWNYIAGEATAVLDSNPPAFTTFDAQGKPGGVSPEFAAWAKARELSLTQATELIQQTDFLKLLTVAETGDARGVPLMRRALASPNFMIQLAGIQGLAQANETRSVPLIVAAVENAPRDLRPVLARYAVYFYDPAAQALVDKYLQPEVAKALRESRQKYGNKPFGE